MYCCATLMCQLKEERQLKEIAQQVADEAQAKNAALEQQVCLCKRRGRCTSVCLPGMYRFMRRIGSSLDVWLSDRVCSSSRSRRRGQLPRHRTQSCYYR